jgi:xylulokinase
MLPFFNGERTPNLPRGRASVNGITAANFNKANIARAALESAIFGMRIGLERFGELGFNAREIRITGGGAKSKLWQQIAANVMKAPLRVPNTSEAAAMGGALQALWCAELAAGNPCTIEETVAAHVALDGAPLMPDSASTKAYDAAYAEYSKYLTVLSPLYR